jgi:hypothetical protein
MAASGLSDFLMSQDTSKYDFVQLLKEHGLSLVLISIQDIDYIISFDFKMRHALV